MNTQHCIDTCNLLLEGERSAVQTYEKAIAKNEPNLKTSELERIKSDHVSAVEKLRQNVLNMGGTPSEGSGAWGSMANAVQSVGNLFGDKGALHTLKAGESSGKGFYEKALEDDQVMPDCKEMIRSELLPQCDEHLRTLEALSH